jgi:hypothetical protein
MNNIPDDLFKQIQDAICRPEGTVTFGYTSEVLFDRNAPGVFRVERDDKLQLSFFHSSPGTGTRVATIDLKKVKPSSKVFLTFSWTPKEIQLHIGPKIAGGQLVSAKGFPSPRQFRVGSDGSIFQIGDLGVEVMQVNVYQNGKPILQPTALEAWKDTIQAVRILSSGSSEMEHIFEVVVTNLSLSILVTGLEAYCQTRFLEVEQEGIKPNIDALISKFFSQKERDAGVPGILGEESKQERISIIQKIAKKRINFQNYGDLKNAFNKAYGIKFGEIGVKTYDLQLLQRLIKYRHRVVHISPLIDMLNQQEVPPEEPVFSNKKLKEEAIKCFDSFVTNFHEATLNLKRPD